MEGPLLRVKNFLDNNRAASIATVAGRSKDPQIAVVYYLYENGILYFVTEKSSRKAENILKNKKLALLILQETQLEMLQLEGHGELIKDTDERVRIIQKIYNRLSKMDVHDPWPLMKLHPKNLEAFEIDIEWFKYSNFANNAVILEGKGSDLNKSPREQESSRDPSSPHHPRFFPHLTRR